MNAIISQRILAHVANGSTPAEAVDAVLGAGTFERVAGEVFDALKAERLTMTAREATDAIYELPIDGSRHTVNGRTVSRQAFSQFTIEGRTYRKSEAVRAILGTQVH